MSKEKPRFTLLLKLIDNYNYENDLSMAIDLDEVVRISPRIVEDLKAGPSISEMSFEQTVKILQCLEFRKDLFIQAAKRVATLMAERMEDAEGWHDLSRINPARQELGGKWE